METTTTLTDDDSVRCACPDCGCDEPATTTDDGGTAVCEACAEYAVDEDGDTYCSRRAEYVDAGEWTGGGMHGCGTGWVSRPSVDHSRAESLARAEVRP